MSWYQYINTVISFLIMVAIKVLQRFLWLARYPSFAKEGYSDGTSNGSSSLYRVGAIQTRLSDESVTCQIHYPTSLIDEKPKIQTKVFTPYFRSNAIRGLSDYGKQPESLLQFLRLRQHPCHINAEPIAILEEQNENDQLKKDSSSLSSLQDKSTTKSKLKQFPIVLFSHGLGGCMEMYTQFCQQLSSYGYIVVAVEHEDGSGVYAEKFDSTTTSNDENSNNIILYKRPDDTPYTRTKVVTFRQPFLQKRVDEINTIIENILVPATRTSATNTNDNNNFKSYQKDTTTTKSTTTVVHPLLDKILQIRDTTNGISFVGHSFGAACMIVATQQALQKSLSTSTSASRSSSSSGPGSTTITKDDDTIRYVPNSITVFDPWCFAVSNDVLKDGIGIKDDMKSSSSNNNIPILSILSENWATNNPERKQIDYWLQQCQKTNKNNIGSYYIPNTGHASISDASTWLPRFIGKRVYMCHPKEPKHTTIPVAANACAQHISQSISTGTITTTTATTTTTTSTTSFDNTGNDNNAAINNFNNHLKVYDYLKLYKFQ